MADNRIDSGLALQAAKKELRAVMTARLKAVTPGERLRHSQLAAVIAAALPAWSSASLVLAFLSMPAEIDTLPVIELALEAGKKVAVPRIDDGDLAFIELNDDWRSWPLDHWSISTPPADAPILLVSHIAALHCLALVPGLAFDRTGGRLGRGKGYYDRFLASVQASSAQTTTDSKPIRTGPEPVFTTAAYGYEFQEVPTVPMGRQDVRLQELVLS